MFDLARKICVMSVALSALLATSCIKEQEQSSDDTTLVSVGQMAPDFTVEMLDGDTIRLSDLRGDVVLLTFWDPRCPTCVQLMDVSEERIVKRIDQRYPLSAYIERLYARIYGGVLRLARLSPPHRVRPAKDYLLALRLKVRSA